METKDTSANPYTSHPFPTFTKQRSRDGLATLWRAYACAIDAGTDVWEFALEVDQLDSAGLTVSDLRWLVAKGFADHGRESSRYGDAHRSFEKATGLKFETETCFVLTKDGATFAAKTFEDSNKSPSDPVPPLNGKVEPGGSEQDSAADSENGGSPAAATTKPHWISGRRELWFGDQLVKRFRVPARNQEWILEVLEEDGWPGFIDDPLPPSPDIDSKARLHDAINRLNHKQTNPLLRFHGNGNGKGVYWEVV